MTNSQKLCLADYRPSDYFIDTTELSFNLEPTKTIVRSKLVMRPNPKTNKDAAAPLILDGTNMKLISVNINGEPVENYTVDEASLTINNVSLLTDGTFVLETEVEINPEENHALEGLYISGPMFSTQCEAHGFRRITYFLDRPDVMSIYTVRLEADKEKFPILLSNGNKVEEGKTENGRHYAVWSDPYKKPSYLFALVAGDLKCKQDKFTTKSGQDVDLYIWVEEKDLGQIDFAMESLKQAFLWDEKVYGLEYDLEIFNIVAVSHFNMGAMENKSLNIFNTSCVLGNKDTATDAQLDQVRDVIAHEEFHNWSGNRVTCQNFFYLSLKEGFTVFRDASFNKDHGDPLDKLIEDTQVMRGYQFKEDSGTNAHAVLPKVLDTFNNIYTLTVYEKGAQIIGMYKTLLGDEAFYQGAKLYFERHDGQAVTIEDFCKAMEDASGKDLSQFRLWYHQAGTPHVELTGKYNEKAQTFTLNAKQSCRETPETENKQPFLIPIRIGLVDEHGQDISLSMGDHGVIELIDSEQTFVFKNIESKPVPSLFRDFSAPVTYNYPYTNEELLFLIAHDSNAFNAWDASQIFARKELLEIIAGEKSALDEGLVEAYRNVLTNPHLTDAEKSNMLTLPSEGDLSLNVEVINPEVIHNARKAARKQIGQALEPDLIEAYRNTTAQGEYDREIKSKARRTLHNTSLAYLCAANDAHLALAQEQFKEADNMTEIWGAFMVLAHCKNAKIREETLEAFYERYQDHKLLVGKWFSAQASLNDDDTLKIATNLLEHEKFDSKSANDIRAVVGAFTGNTVQFHKIDGSGYQFVADYILNLDQRNPQTAARFMDAFSTWKKYTPEHQKLMKAELKRIVDTKDLSKDVRSKAQNALA